MDRCDSQMEAANPCDPFWSHAAIFVELRDQMATAASEVLRKPCQIDIIWRLLEYPPGTDQTRRRGRRGRQSFSDYVFYGVKPSGPVECGFRMSCEEPGKSTIDIL